MKEFMARRDEERDRRFLRDWQIARMSSGLDFGIVDAIPNLTALLYFFRKDEEVERCFPFSAQALHETWRHCGKIRTVIVTNQDSAPIRRFADANGNVEIQVEESLAPGDITAMSADCNAKLFRRFSTEYVLIVQDDGFPLRSGLDDFIGRYDFVGAPYRRRGFLGVAAGVVKKSWPMNGGFSLRSRRFCKAVAEYWNRYYMGESSVPECADDIFCTITLPKRFPAFFQEMRWPTSRVAARFSYEAILPMNKTVSPIGFHGAASFRELMQGGSVG